MQRMVFVYHRENEEWKKCQSRIFIPLWTFGHQYNGEDTDPPSHVWASISPSHVWVDQIMWCRVVNWRKAKKYCSLWMLKNHLVPGVTMWLVEDGLNLYWWVVEPKTLNQALKLAWWLMMHSFLICCYAGLLIKRTTDLL